MNYALIVLLIVGGLFLNSRISSLEDQIQELKATQVVISEKRSQQEVFKDFTNMVIELKKLEF